MIPDIHPKSHRHCRFLTAKVICFVWLNDVWVPARVEMGDDRKWYLVGMPGLELDGLEVKAE